MTDASLFDNLEKINFSPGDLLLKEGDAGYFFYIIQDGTVEIFRAGDNNEETPLGTVQAGQPLGEFALMTRSLRSASARAVTGGVAIKVSEIVYQRLLDSLPDWAMAIMTSLIQRLQIANRAVLHGETLDFEKTIVEEGTRL